jgi:hypothetical protein
MHSTVISWCFLPNATTTTIFLKTLLHDFFLKAIREQIIQLRACSCILDEGQAVTSQLSSENFPSFMRLSCFQNIFDYQKQSRSGSLDERFV